MKDVLFLDQDDTLGDFEEEGEGLFSGALGFCETQARSGRSLAIATTAHSIGRTHLLEIDHLISHYFSREFSSADWYRAEDGKLRRVDDDYAERANLPGIFEQEIRRYQELERICTEISRGAAEDEFDDLALTDLEHITYTMGTWNECDSEPAYKFENDLGILAQYLSIQVHKTSGEPLDHSQLYRNPHTGRAEHLKDLFLARYHIAGEDHQSLRTAMVGNKSDILSLPTDPHTPLIVVYPTRDRSSLDFAGFEYASAMLDVLYGENLHPYQVFDNLLEKNSTFSTKGHRFKLERTEHSTRIIIPEAAL